MALAAALRFPGLMAQSLWIDEIYSVDMTRWSLYWVLRAQDGVIEVLPATGDFDHTQPLRLVLAHPSQASADLHIELAPSALGWRADAPLDSSHDWSLQLLPIDSSWRLRGRLLKRQQAARLAPAVAGR